MPAPAYALADYDFELPDGLVAQQPAAERDRSRLMVVRRGAGRLDHRRFDELPGLLAPGDLLVVNDTAVVPARLRGRKETGGRVEVLLLDYAEGVRERASRGGFQCPCLVRASRRPAVGSRLRFDGGLEAVVVAFRGDLPILRFSAEGDVEDAIARVGEPPLPPYIRRDPGGGPTDRDTLAYQTVYAARKGAVAAPTAGLHFTEGLFGRLAAAGVETAFVTLHVGYGTFMPVRATDIRDHTLHSEWCAVPPETAQAVNRAKAEGRRVVAVGSTSTRTLENATDDDGRVRTGSGPNGLFIYPGYTFRTVDALITNFHLPRSTLILLVSAFAGRETVLAAYREAVERQYRFYSYGDAMLIL